MPTQPDHDDILQAVLAEEGPPVPGEEAIQAMLADPGFNAIVTRATSRVRGLLTQKGEDFSRRTLAMVFLMAPRAASLLAQVRDAEGSTAKPTGAEPARKEKTS
jgi:hypothetical protein